MKHATPIMAIFTLVVALLGGYVGAYLWLSVIGVELQPPFGITRCYRHDWLVQLFKPAAVVESILKGGYVGVERLPDDLNLE